jgi:Ras-related protein Rab-30
MATMDDYRFLFKVVLVGNAGVGKTCLVRRFTQGMFPPGQGATIGVDFMIKTVEVDGEKIKVGIQHLQYRMGLSPRHMQLQIWDTAGQERFRSITQSYYRSAHALILVYDVANQPTFDCCGDWLREIEEYAAPNVFKALVGNKTDRDDREIPADVGQDFASRHGMHFLETSAKASENVERLFTEIATELLQVRQQQLHRTIKLLMNTYVHFQRSRSKDLARPLPGSYPSQSQLPIAGSNVERNYGCCSKFA